jgi:nucleolar protein 6
MTQKKYLLFVGNLSYKTTKEDMERHFQAESGVACQAVRLQTDKATKKPKGFAFCEFASHLDLEQALALHHTELLGRKINVELTAGGGGSKSEKRKLKIREKNEKYHQEKSKFKVK